MGILRLASLVPLSIAVVLLSLTAMREALMDGEARLIGLYLGTAFVLLGVKLYIVRYEVLDELIADLLERRRRVGIVPSEKGFIRGTTFFALAAVLVSSIALLLRYIAGAEP
ncbi:MAG: hypothetical protein GXO66_07745 [Euryarchaeota archaeon]|nr:hypothetical protein [Euryarchaeota archaeon]